MKKVFIALLLIFCLCTPAHTKQLVSFKTRFVAKTNVGFNIVGKSNKQIKTSIEYNHKDKFVKNLYIEIEPTSLKTGMKVRDSHMLKRVFNDESGKTHNIIISGKNVHLQKKDKGRFIGNFKVSFRGMNQNLPVSIKLLSSSSATAEATINITDFNVKKISLMGVKVKPKVSVFIDEIKI